VVREGAVWAWMALGKGPGPVTRLVRFARAPPSGLRSSLWKRPYETFLVCGWRSKDGRIVEARGTPDEVALAIHERVIGTPL
jgi:hypothetical protein